jgi:hypothetical protein
MSSEASQAISGSDMPCAVEPAWDEAGLVHEVAQGQAVADSDDEAGAEQEHPVVDRDVRLTGQEEQGEVRAAGVLPQGHDREEAEDSGGHEGALGLRRTPPVTRSCGVAAERSRGWSQPQEWFDEVERSKPFVRAFGRHRAAHDFVYQGDY